MLLALLLLLAGERAALGVFDRWAALRDGASCFAVARPVRDDGTTDGRGGFVRVAVRQGAMRSPGVFFRLSSARGQGAEVTLTIDERRFALIGDALTAHAPDAASDRAIVSAMRGARTMTLSTVDATGRAVVDRFALAGAPTAIDAAQLECASS